MSELTTVAYSKPAYAQNIITTAIPKLSKPSGANGVRLSITAAGLENIHSRPAIINRNKGKFYNRQYIVGPSGILNTKVVCGKKEQYEQARDCNLYCKPNLEKERQVNDKGNRKH